MAGVDVVVIGSGPNGLTAAVTLAEAGLEVHVYEAAARLGGGARTAELTEPGFRHDVCSAIHPFGVGSPAFRALPLERYGLTWLHPELPLAHPFADGTAAVLARDPTHTAYSLGRDGGAYLRLMRPFLGRWNDLADDALRAPLDGLPAHPVLMARFGLRAALPASALLSWFSGDRARGLLAGLAGHAVAPLRSPATAGVGLMLGLAGHEVGWPAPRGGAQAISDALAAYLYELGGQVHTGQRIALLEELPTARAYLFDTSPRDLIAIAGARLPARYVERLLAYRYGPAVFKLDYALDGPVPWTAAECRSAGTVHLGASAGEIGAALDAPTRGRSPDPPFLIAAQPTVFDRTRAPEGKHVLWVYGHVPNGWVGDLTDAIEKQIERFAPGFRDLVRARRVSGPAEVEAYNANYVGGDISCGAFGGVQALLRPVVTRIPYATPDPSIYLCSSATPPGPGVHGMGGYHAARVALRRVLQG